MIRFTHLFILALLFCGAAVPLSSPAISAPLNQAEQAAKDTRAADTIKQLERGNVEARYQKDIAEMKAEVLQSQTSWFEILTSLMIGLFGVLITIVVLVLAWRLDKTARAEITAAKRDMDAQVNAIILLTEQAKEKVGVIDRHLKSAGELMRGTPIGETPKDPIVRKAMAEIAAQAEKKPRSQRTADDYRALVIDAAIKSDWTKMESIASVMVYLFEGETGDETTAFALFNKAYALGELDRREDAVAAYDDFVTRFGGSDNHDLLKHVVTAMVNKGANLSTLNRHEDATAAYDVVIARFDNSDNPDLLEKVAMAMVNKGIDLGTLNRHEDAVAACDNVIARFGDSNYAAVVEQVANALFNRACAFGMLDKAQKCVDSLQAWMQKRGSIDCDMIHNDPDFDNVRDDPAFMAFMAKHDCCHNSPTKKTASESAKPTKPSRKKAV
jgi:tetratricopeptide (TPR) repeat protein